MSFGLVMFMSCWDRLQYHMFMNWIIMNSYAPWCPSDSKSMEGFAEWPFTAVHLCYHAFSVGWVDGLGPSKNKMHLHKIKCWGLTPFYFRSARFFLFFFRGAHPHSLGVRHRRIIIDVMEESLALRNRFKLIACVQALTHTTAKFHQIPKWLHFAVTL